MSKLVDRSVKDRPEIWFMREDGSNLIENVDDIVSVVLTEVSSCSTGSMTRRTCSS